jgi:VWFA-related protein
VGQLLAHRYNLPVLLFLLVCQLCAFGAPGETPETVYRANVSEVRITFSATDQYNHAIATLNPGDLAVLDKDVIVRNFQSFTLAHFTRLEITILIDPSESVGAQYREEIAQVLELISKTSGVPDDSISIVSFEGVQPTLICKGNCRTSQAADLIPSTASGGVTPLYDSVIFSADTLSPQDSEVRRVLIVFSDGEDTISRHSASDAIEFPLAHDIEVYAVAIRPSISRGNVFLQNLAAATGGRTFRLSDGANSVADAVLDDFRASYQLTYKLPYMTEGFHTVRIVATHDSNLHFRCRRGYFYPAGKH